MPLKNTSKCTHAKYTKCAHVLIIDIQKQQMWIQRMISKIEDGERKNTGKWKGASALWKTKLTNKHNNNNNKTRQHELKDRARKMKKKIKLNKSHTHFYLIWGLYMRVCVFLWKWWYVNEIMIKKTALAYSIAINEDMWVNILLAKKKMFFSTEKKIYVKSIFSCGKLNWNF